MPLTIQTTVRETLTATLPVRTRELVVEHFAKKEADKRAAALIGGLDKLTQLDREIKAIKPQHTAFNADGSPVGEPTFTKEQVDSLKKLREQLDKLTKAIDKADGDNADFGDLYNLVK